MFPPQDDEAGDVLDQVGAAEEETGKRKKKRGPKLVKGNDTSAAGASAGA